MSEKGNPLLKLITGVGLVLVLGIGAWAVLAPSYVGSPRSPKHACINNLRQLDGAVQQWALENHKKPGDTPKWSEMANYLRAKVVCPEGGIYNPGSVGGHPTCSIPGHDLPRDPPPPAPR